MTSLTHLPEPDKYYHIFNRGIDGCDLFREKDNYVHFLRLHQKYIFPVAETYAWCLMKNHFHFLIRMRPVQEPNLKGSNNRNPVSQAFSNLFNAYTKAFNKRYDRTGSLFEKNFHRIEVLTELHLRHLVVYIHCNPLHHGFCDNLWDYPWTSYGAILSAYPSKLPQSQVIGWFDDKDNFREVHKQRERTELIEHLIIE
jgi:putative transposase